MSWLKLPEDDAAVTIPIPWNIFLPSNVAKLWSTLSALHWMKAPLRRVADSVVLASRTDCQWSVSSSGVIDKPSHDDCLRSHLEPNLWSRSTPSQNSNEGMVSLLTSLTTHRASDSCFNSEKMTQKQCIPIQVLMSPALGYVSFCRVHLSQF